MQNYAIIVAGGTGSRMQSTIPKQFLLLAGKPVIYYSIQAFLQTFSDIQIIIVTYADYLQHMQTIIDDYTPNNNIQIVIGGQTRYHSVQNGISALPNDADGIVFVHDAARPFITTSLLQQLQADCIANSNAIPVIAIAESLRKLIDINKSVIENRDNIKIVQTPQVFKLPIIIQGFAQDYQEMFTDEASVCEKLVSHIYLSTGLEQNIKITTPHQLQIAELMMANWKV